jgi:hypothetical protein
LIFDIDHGTIARKEGRQGMPNRTASTVVIIGLLASSIVACAGPSAEPTATPTAPTATPVHTPTPVPPSPTPEAKGANYSSTSLALSLWYPETWISDEASDMVGFATSTALMSGQDWETGAAFVVIVSEPRRGEPVENIIQQLLDESALDKLRTTELKPISIGDESGLIMDLEATPMDTTQELRGFVAGVEHNRLTYVAMGIAAKTDWSEFGDTLDSMLRSIRFTEPEGTFASEDLALKIWYPEDWIVEEGRVQVLFATSPDLIENGELQSGAAFMVRGSSMPDVLLVEWFEEELEALTFDAGGLTSDVAPRTVGGREGLIIDLEGVPSGTDSPAAGFVAGVAFEGRAYIFLAVAADDEWPDYSSTLEKMLDSVEFME